MNVPHCSMKPAQALLSRSGVRRAHLATPRFQGVENKTDTPQSLEACLDRTYFSYAGSDYTGKMLLNGLRSALGLGPLGIIPAPGPLKFLPSLRCVSTTSVLVALGLNQHYESVGKQLLQSNHPYVAQYKQQAKVDEDAARERLSDSPELIEAHFGDPSKLGSVNPDPTSLGMTFVSHMTDAMDKAFTDLSHFGAVKEGTYYNFPNGWFSGWKITLKGLASLGQ